LMRLLFNQSRKIRRRWLERGLRMSSRSPALQLTLQASPST
jgi:hypothetical protein